MKKDRVEPGGCLESLCERSEPYPPEAVRAGIIEFCISHRAVARIPLTCLLSPTGGEETGEGDGSAWFLLAMQNSIKGLVVVLMAQQFCIPLAWLVHALLIEACMA